ncbi:multidrug effflux MFS transporter [Microbulbifer thermotolerans]|uniref:Bcr/CflA family efflux transporter n=1 Tax=Microbulbifer thermotolerans TaxID=252514 RepID=A0AB35HW25_MICTH|nr:multidrug effflux MFS transporter [Microbulbifer thermotolerans]MCX2801763.1 multidrug effflux MFS transporter [Microbulbifer thermotolerans]MCX2840952.1 multidrug effflux MFS transporter [Microbulbifer thermotolerans]
MSPAATRTDKTPPRWLAVWLAILVALTPLSIDSYLPAIPAMAEALNTVVARVQHSVSSFLLGFAIGQLFGGPLSDRWGRRLVGTIGLGIYIASSALVLFTNHVDQLIILRFLQAIGGGFATVICAAIVRDLHSGREAAKIISMISTMMLVAPLVAPVIGSMLLATFGWQSIFIFLLIYAAAMLMLVQFLLPETVSRFSRARRQRKPMKSLIESYGQVMGNRRALGFLAAQACVSGAMFIYVTTAPFVFMRYFEVPASQFPLYFGVCVLGLICMVQVNIRLLNLFEPRNILLAGILLQMVGCGLLLLGTLTGGKDITLWMVPLVLVMACIGITGPNAAASFLEFFPKISGSANALYGATIFTTGGFLGGIVNSLHTGTLIPIAAAMLGCAVAALLAAVFIARAQKPIEVAVPAARRYVPR